MKTVRFAAAGASFATAALIAAGFAAQVTLAWEAVGPKAATEAAVAAPAFQRLDPIVVVASREPIQRLEPIVVVGRKAETPSA